MPHGFALSALRAERQRDLHWIVAVLVSGLAAAFAVLWNSFS